MQIVMNKRCKHYALCNGQCHAAMGNATPHWTVPLNGGQCHSALENAMPRCNGQYHPAMDGQWNSVLLHCIAS